MSKVRTRFDTKPHREDACRKLKNSALCLSDRKA